MSRPTRTARFGRSGIRWPRCSAFSLALVVYNIHAVLLAAARAVHPPVKTGVNLSVYYVAHEIASGGMAIALNAAYWTSA